MARGEGEGQVISRDVEPIRDATIRSGASSRSCDFHGGNGGAGPSVIAAVGSAGFMAVFKTNFILGMLVGVALAAWAPVAGTELVATFSAPAKASVAAHLNEIVPQTVNRAAKSDRIRPAHNAIGNSPSKSPKIPDGCDPAFSPLSRGASSNFSGRCLT
jgi:hypothetical protein